jgi:hypothetical protein
MIIFQSSGFTNSFEADKIVYYEYFPLLSEKIKSGMEIYKINNGHGYCVLDYNGRCNGNLYILDPKYLNYSERNMTTLVKFEINTSNFNMTEYRDIAFKNNIPVFESKENIVLNDSRKELVTKIKKMLLIYDTIKKMKLDDKFLEEDITFKKDKPKKIFSTYIIIKIPELSFPHMYVLDYDNADDSVWRAEYTGKSLDELYQNLKQFIAENRDKNGKIPIEKYNKFMEDEIYGTNFYPELTKKILELKNDFMGYFN